MIDRKMLIKTTVFLFLLSSTVFANPYHLQYGGRIVNSNGQPIAGPLNIEINFYSSQSSGTSVAAQSFSSVALSDGVFQVLIDLSDADFHTVFSSPEVWVEVTDLTNGTIYPRQQFTAVPFAFKTPTDGSSIDYDSNGKLKLIGISGAALPSGSPAEGQVLKWSGGSWNWSDDLIGGAAGSVDSTTIADNSITDSDISSSASIDQSKVNGLVSDLSGKEPTIAAGTAGQYWRGDKSWQTLDTDAVSEGTNQYFTDGRARNAISSSGGALTYNSSTGQFSLPAASSGTDGYLSSADWLTFNDKQAPIGSSTTVDAGTITTAQQSGIELKAFGTSVGETGELRFHDATDGTTNYVGFKAPDAITTNKIWTLPAADGTNGQCLVTNGNGTLSWAGLNSGTVTSITAGTGLSGGTITGSGTIDLANTGVTAGSFTRANITVDAQGRLTSAANGSNVNLTSEVTGTLPIANGGTGASTVTDARNNLGLGALATVSSVSGGAGGNIADDSITNADISSSAGIADSKLATISAAGKVANSATTAASANTANAIVARDALGNFSAGTITANLTGNADTATTAGNVSGTVAVANGGTGASTATDARSNLGLGSLATQNSNAVNITGGTISGINIESTGIDDNASATAITILSDGKVGIGTSNPSHSLEVAGYIKSTSGGFAFPDGSTMATSNSLWYSLKLAKATALLSSPGGSNIKFDAGDNFYVNNMNITNSTNSACGSNARIVCAKPGDTVSVSFNFMRPAAGWCPSCVQYFSVDYVRFDDLGTTAAAGRISCRGTYYGTSVFGSTSGSGSWTIPAGTTPGVYLIQATSWLDFTCSGYASGLGHPTMGIINVYPN